MEIQADLGDAATWPTLRAFGSRAILPEEQRFEMHYSVVRHFTRDIDEPRSNRQTLGPAQPRCAWTEHAKEIQTFRTEAHLIPELAGNKWLFTREECDGCNHRNGRDLENELGKFLHAERVVARVRGKGGLPSLGKSGGSRLSATAHALTVDVEAHDRSIEVDRDAMRITLLRPPFRPHAIVRSLARMAWLSLPDEQRHLHEQVRRVVEAGDAGAPGGFWHWFIPGPGLRSLSLTVWERRANGDERLAPLALRLAFGTTVLDWLSPQAAAGPMGFTMLPPIAVSPYPRHEPTVREWTVGLPSERVTGGRATFHFGSLAAGSGDGLPEEAVLPAEERFYERDVALPAPLPVRLESGVDDQEQVVARAWMQMLSSSEGGIVASISGGLFAGEIRLVAAAAQGTLEPKVDIAGVPCARALSSLRFIEALVATGRLRVIDLRTDRVVIDDTGRASPDGDDSLRREIDVFEALNAIWRRLGIDLNARASVGLTQTEREIVVSVADLMGGTDIVVAPPSGHVTVTLSTENAVRLGQALAHGDTVFSVPVRVSLRVADVELDPGPLTATFLDLAPDQADGIALAASAATTGQVKLTVKCRAVGLLALAPGTDGGAGEPLAIARS